MAQDKKICVGVVLGAHGVRGEVRLRSFTAEPEAIFRYKPLTDEAGIQTFVVKKKGVIKDGFTASFKDSDSREAAEALRGTKLYIERANLPKPKKGEYYEADLIGLAAQDAEGVVVGAVMALHNYGAGAFLEIKPPQGDSFMLPFTDACVPEVDIAGGLIRVAIPEGWLAPAKPPKDEEE